MQNLVNNIVKPKNIGHRLKNHADLPGVTEAHTTKSNRC